MRHGTTGEFRGRALIAASIAAGLGLIMWVFLARWGVLGLFRQMAEMITF